MIVTGQAKQIVYTHGTWSSMIDRCTKPKNKSYPDYGGRGITVCERWLESFDNFIEDMGIKPEGTSIERIDVNGNYCPENCCWANPKTQAQNTRASISITWGGITKNASDWARDFGIGISTFHARYKAGMTMEEIRDIPILGTSAERARNRRNAVMLTANGKTQSMAAWAEELGVVLGSLWQRKKMGWSDEDIVNKPMANKPEEVLLTFNGKTQNQEAWGKELGVSGHAISVRLKRGLPIEQVLSEDRLVRVNCSATYDFKGSQKTITEISDILNVSRTLVWRRIKAGVNPNDMLPKKETYVKEVTLTYQGKTLNLNQWGKELGISGAAIKARMVQGLPLEQVLSSELLKEKKHMFQGMLRTAKEIGVLSGKNAAAINRLIRLGKPLE